MCQLCIKLIMQVSNYSNNKSLAKSYSLALMSDGQADLNKLFLSFFNCVPSSIKLGQFNAQSISGIITENYKTKIIESIKHVSIKANGLSYVSCYIYIFKNRIIVKVEKSCAEILFDSANEEFVTELTKALIADYFQISSETLNEILNRH